ncbi:MAG: hypothetical protein WC755_00700 [Candidatus Woesearchaeota archaeon]|jgi:hypothetical protein
MNLKQIISLGAITALTGCAGLKPVESIKDYCTPNETVNIENNSILTSNKEIRSLENVPDQIQKVINESGAKVIYSFVDKDTSQENKYLFLKGNQTGFCRTASEDGDKKEAYVSPVGTTVPNLLFSYLFPILNVFLIIEDKFNLVTISLHEYGHIVDNELYVVDNTTERNRDSRLENIMNLFIEEKINIDSFDVLIEKLLFDDWPKDNINIYQLDKTNYTNFDSSGFSYILRNYNNAIEYNFIVGNSKKIRLSSTPEFRYIFELYKDKKLLSSDVLFPNNPDYANANEQECFAQYFSAFYGSEYSRNEMKEQVPLLYKYFSGIENKMIKDEFLCHKRKSVDKPELVENVKLKR